MSANGKHVAIYVRVSSGSQSIESQMPDLRTYAAKLEADSETVKWYEDHATGRKMDRPGMDALMSDLLDGRVKEIVCWRLDRLGRTARGLCNLCADCSKMKADLKSLRDNFDLNTPTGRLQFHILASVAEFETEIRAERQRAGIEAAKEKAKDIRRLGDSGWTVEALARKYGLKEDKIRGILSGKDLWWGGSRSGHRAKPLPPMGAIQAFMRAGMNIHQIAAACKCGVTTLYDRYPIRKMRAEVKMGRQSA